MDPDIRLDQMLESYTGGPIITDDPALMTAAILRGLPTRYRALPSDDETLGQGGGDGYGYGFSFGKSMGHGDGNGGGEAEITIPRPWVDVVIQLPNIQVAYDPRRYMQQMRALMGQITVVLEEPTYEP